MPHKYSKEYYILHIRPRLLLKGKIKSSLLRCNTEKKSKILMNQHAHISYRYGMSIDAYNKLLSTQDNRCAICKRHEDSFKRRLAIDHDHITNKVRGLLCHNCNSLLGHAHDKIDILKESIKYLENQKEL